MRHALKVLFAVALVFSFIGIANAAGIPVVTDPIRAPEIWTLEVYNNLGSDITSGSVVVWDCRSASSTTGVNEAAATDVAMYVTTVSDIDSPLVAGVVVDSTLETASTGTICIFGPIYVLCQDATEGVTESELVANSATAGRCGDFSGADAEDAAVLGFALASGPNTVANGGFGGTAGQDFLMIPIFVDISRFYHGD